jgi:carboxypeptidase family protein/TonB-dependent receptor-like protein
MPESRRGCAAGVRRIAVLLFFVSCSLAQLPVGTISGVVQDSSGAVIPGATATATNRETGLVRTAATSGNGRFVLPALPVGNYDVKVEAPAFAPQSKQNLSVAIGQESVANFALAVGNVAEAVTVTADAPLVQTTSGSLGGLVDEQRVSELPLNGRNFNELVLLQTGIAVHKQTSLTSSTGSGLVFSSNGAPIRSNYMTMDGANLASAEGLTGVSITGSMLGVEGIQEYRVITNSFPAEYGMTMGSQITVATKSGTNQFHGTIFEFLRNSALDARNFFDRKLHPDDPRIPAFRRNNFGFSVGGPFRKDRSFFFTTYEGNRERLGLTKVLSTITADARRDGAAIYLNGLTSAPTVIPQIAANVKPYLALYPLPTEPLPTDPNQLTGVGRYTYVFKQPTREDFGQFRVDHNFSINDTLFSRYTISDTGQTDSAENWPIFPRIASSRGQFLTLAENHTLTPSLLNLVRASWSRTFGRYDSPTITDPTMEFVPGEGMGSVAPSSGVTPLGPSTPWILFNQNLYTVSDDVFSPHGSHGLKFGLLTNRYQVYMEPTTSRRGSYSFANLGQFLLGSPRQFTVQTPGSVTYRAYRWYTWGFYAQDDWRVNSKLTFNLGLRYEFNTSVNEHSGRGSHIVDALHDDRFVVAPALAENNSKKNISPRFGFAWDPWGNGKTALRGGFGLLYDIANMAGAAQINATASPPFSSQSQVTTPTFIVTFPKTAIPAAAAGKSIRIADFYLQQPHMLHYNLTVERQLPGSFSISAAYVATRGINLYQTKEGNPALPGGIPQNGVCVARPAGQAYVTDGPKCWLGGESRLNPNWASNEFKTAGGDSWYHGLQVSVQRRLGQGLQLQSSYTWSKALDTTQGQKGGESGGASNTGVDPDNPAVDKGSSDFDVRHSWTVNALYRLPFPAGGSLGKVLGGWRLSSILKMSSGLPFTPSLSGNRSRSQVGGGNADRPDLVAGRKPDDIILGGPDKYFDPAAFAIQPVGFLGSASRNFLKGPGQVNLDFSLSKETALRLLGESGRLEMRFEMFNIANHANFNIPVAGRTVFTATETTANLTPQSTAGTIDRTRGDARKIQFGLKLAF